MEVTKGYKQTEVGIIPENWDVVPIKSVASVKTGPFGSTLHERDYVQDGTPIITVEHLSEHGVVHSNLPMVSNLDLQRLNVYSLRTGDIVFSRVGSVDRNSLISEKENGWLFSGRLLRIRAENKYLHTPFLSYYFHSEPFKQRVRSVAVGQTMASLNTQILNAIQIIVPPLPEQRTIAAALSDVDSLLASLDELIAKKRLIKEGAMQELLKGKMRLQGFHGKGNKLTEVGVIPEDWDVTSLSKICQMKSGDGITSADIDQFSKYPCYGGNGIRGFTSRYTHDGQYALIGRQGALCGNVLGVEGKFFASEHAVVVTPYEQTDIHWLTYMLGDMRLNQYSESSAQPGLSVSKLLKLTIAFPTNKFEQTAIVEILSDMDAEIAALEARREKTSLLKQGMMQELLTGKIRLV